MKQVPSWLILTGSLILLPFSLYIFHLYSLSNDFVWSTSRLYYQEAPSRNDCITWQTHLKRKSGLWCTHEKEIAYCSAGPLGSYNITKAGQNSERKARQKPPKLVSQPTTLFFGALNIFLAFYYWNYRVDASEVGLINNGNDAWRVWSGALAHFDPWHILFNLSSWYSIGTELENRIIPSLEFFLYTITFIPTIGLIWSLLSKASSTPTVGFSGVLFAWMLIDCLEQRYTCPVFFLPSFCLETYSFGAFKFSFSPLIQLVLIQVIVPRASFTGHLAGILVGFLWHLGLMPLTVFQPAVIVPLLHAGFLLKRDGRPKFAYGKMFWIGTCLAILSAVFHQVSTWLPWIPLLIFQTATGNDAWRRGFVVAAVFAIVTDSLTLSCYVLLRSASIEMIVLLLCRMTWVLGEIIRHASAEGDSCSGIYRHVFEATICRPSRRIMNWRRPFEGTGRRLGDSSITRETQLV